MRHRKDGRKLGRKTAHRKALLSALVCALIERKRIRTGLAKAREAGRLAEKMVSLARRGTLAARRYAFSVLRQEKPVRILFGEIVPKVGERRSGFTRIVKLGRRKGDGAELAILEWTDIAPPPRKKREKKKEGEKEK
ncbi:MAG: 50S ribosomal protein L17 [Kiritimatiellae bacterium]|nr:50S ribosomal protein L17 [Kiritimatiellia bacterium]